MNEPLAIVTRPLAHSWWRENEAPPTIGQFPNHYSSSISWLAGIFLVAAFTSVLLMASTTSKIDRIDAPAQALVLPPADSLAGVIGRFIALVARGVDDRAEAAGLGRALLGPVLALLGPGISRLVIVPDGPLHRGPWDALRLSDGHYVVERYAVGIAPSAGALGALLRRPREQPVDSSRLLAFGDPDFAGVGDTLRVAGEPLPTAKDLPRLPGSRAEARLVAR